MSDFPYYSGATGSQNQYHPIQNPSLNEPTNNNTALHTGLYSVQSKSDQQYFGSLKHFRPLGYSGKGSPIFLINDRWWGSLGCLIVFNVVFCICVAFYAIVSSNTDPKPRAKDSIFPAGNQRSSNDTFIIVLSSAICLILIDVSYFFCQFMNPGVVNVTNLADQEFNENGKKFCEHCRCYRTEDMNHCKECHVCVWGLDHHCGFFNKCIAGWQKWAFYAFLTSLFGGFLLIIVCLGMVLVFL